MHRLTRAHLVVLAVVALLAIPLWRVAYPWLALAEQRARAERLYRDGSFKASYDAFRELGRQLLARHRTDLTPVVSYNTGNAAYRQGRFDDAIRGYREALVGDSSLMAQSDFNLGNAYIWLSRAEADKRGSLQAAVNAFEEALVVDPHDADAKWNLEIAIERLHQEEERLSGGHLGEADWGGGNATKAGYTGAPQAGAGASPGAGFGNGNGEDPVQQLSESDARRMLKEVEQTQLSGQDVRKSRRDTRPSRRKDW